MVPDDVVWTHLIVSGGNRGRVILLDGRERPWAIRVGTEHALMPAIAVSDKKEDPYLLLASRSP